MKICQECDDHSENLLQHYVTVHLRLIICHSCDLAFKKSTTDFQIHLFQNHSERSAILIHDKGEMRCPNCDISFDNFVEFEEHFKTSSAHINMHHKCTVRKCKSRFQSPTSGGIFKSFLTHLFKNHLNCKFSCAASHCTFTSESPLHVLVHGKQHLFDFYQRHCKLCRKKMSSQLEYGRHMSWHRNHAKWEPCDICGSRVFKTAMKRHRILHFKCTKCGQKCNSKTELNKHNISVHLAAHLAQSIRSKSKSNKGVIS